MIYLILFFLLASLLLYTILGGADFGAGILELFTRKRDTQKVRNLTYKAIGPVWEANHIWLILIVVILFVAFPEVYRLLSVHLHIPIMLMLLGIILRGAAFIFRHYDAIKDGSQKTYSRVFISASFLTSLFLGITAGATILGRIDPEIIDFYGAYIGPWFNAFSIALGIFFTAVCAFLAAVFLVGETDDPALKRMFYRQTVGSNIVAVISGIGVFVAAGLQGLALHEMYLESTMTIASVILATFIVPLLWRTLNQGHYQWARLLAGAEVALILFGWLWVQFPAMIRLANDTVTYQAAQAPDAVLNVMGWVLIGGALLIFPSLYYLFRVFKFEQAAS
ncbi:MAG: cytochrome d ubiquinol oxidase subunit II [Bacteroidota bacterium]